MDRCEGLLQLVGDAYGAEPPDVHPEYGRVSYTQFELFRARLHARKTRVIEVQRDCPRDTRVDQLVLASDPAYPDAFVQEVAEWFVLYAKEVADPG